MLMLNFHLNLSLQLIALGIGAIILIWSKMQKSTVIYVTKVLGYLIVIISILNMACTINYAIKAWKAGYFDNPSQMVLQGQTMKKEMMMRCLMMQSQMNQEKIPTQKSAKQTPGHQKEVTSPHSGKAQNLIMSDNKEI